MKKILLTLCCLAVFGAVRAQYTERRSIHEIRFGYGWLTSNGVLDGSTEMLGTAAGTDMTYGNESRSGAFALSYRCRLMPKFRLGATFAYEKVTKDYLYRLPDEGMQLFTTPGKNRFLTLTVDTQFTYLQTPSGVFALYWSASAGVTFHRQRLEGLDPSRRSRTRFAYQFSPLGMTLGAKQLGLFGEVGFGYRGIFQLGIYARF